MLFWKKERQVRESVEEYLQTTEQCLQTFVKAFEEFFTAGLTERFRQFVDKTHELEHAADERRREIETRMYDKALIPESRGDILEMLEAIDLVPNRAESILYQIWTQGMSVPSEYVEDFQRLIQANVESHWVLCTAMRDLFRSARDVAVGAQRVSDKEQQADQIERRLIKAVFDSAMDKTDKILLKELILHIGSISDRAENASDRLRIVAVKRQS